MRSSLQTDQRARASDSRNRRVRAARRRDRKQFQGCWPGLAEARATQMAIMATTKMIPPVRVVFIHFLSARAAICLTAQLGGYRNVVG